MKGHILNYDANQKTGYISGHDGNRYQFSSDEWQGQGEPREGVQVDFEIEGDQAKGIIALNSQSGGNASTSDTATKVSWTFGVLFLLAGLGRLFEHGEVIFALVTFAIAGVLLPPVREYVYAKTERQISTGVRAIIIIALFGIAGLLPKI